MKELSNSTGGDIPDWQQKEVLMRLQNLIDNPHGAISWDIALKKIEELAKD